MEAKGAWEGDGRGRREGLEQSRLGKYFVMSSTLRPGNCCSPHAIVTATLMILHQFLRLSVTLPDSLLLPLLPHPLSPCHVSQVGIVLAAIANVVTIIYALVMTDNKALKNSNRSRQPSARDRDRTRSRAVPDSEWEPVAKT